MTEEPTGPAGSGDGVDPAGYGPANASYPYHATDDLRSGADLNGELLSLLPLVGRWRGTGKGGHPQKATDGPKGEDFDFAQEVRFAHDGRPFLSYHSRTWLIDPDGRPLGPGSLESGFWRPNGPDGLEALLTTAEGFLQLFVGDINGTRFDLATDAMVRAPDAAEITGEKRLYGIVEGDLMYAAERSGDGFGLTPYASARLVRVTAAPK